MDFNWHPIDTATPNQALNPKPEIRRSPKGLVEECSVARILVIDDNEDVCAVVCGVLESAGHEAIHAADGARGVRIQRESPAALVITDIFMPEKEGLETIRDLRREFPDLKVIAMSGGGARLKGTYHLFAAEQLGAHAVLQKPFEPSSLLETVRTVLKVPSE